VVLARLVALIRPSPSPRTRSSVGGEPPEAPPADRLAARSGAPAAGPRGGWLGRGEGRRRDDCGTRLRALGTCRGPLRAALPPRAIGDRASKAGGRHGRAQRALVALRLELGVSHSFGPVAG